MWKSSGPRRRDGSAWTTSEDEGMIRRLRSRGHRRLRRGATSSDRFAPMPIPGSNYATRRNPGGLRSSKGAFRYLTLEDGVKAMDTLLGEKYFPNPAYNTIDEYVTQYVGPIGRYKVEEYKRNVSAWSGVPRKQVIDVNDRVTRNALLAAALRQESGGDWRHSVNDLFGKEVASASSGDALWPNDESEHSQQPRSGESASDLLAYREISVGPAE